MKDVPRALTKWQYLKKWIKKQDEYIQDSGLYDSRDKITVHIWTGTILEEMEELEAYEEIL